VVPPEDAKVVQDYFVKSKDMVPSSNDKQSQIVEHYIVPGAGHQVMIVNPELVNPVITEFLIKSCGLETLSGAWQILNKTAGENKWDLKNYEKVDDLKDIMLYHGFANKCLQLNSGSEPTLFRSLI
jgi:hypothetical protein